jgi:hypothetical protein
MEVNSRFLGLQAISEFGEIRRIKPSRTRRIGHTSKAKPSKSGYTKIKLVDDNGIKRSNNVNHFIALAFHGPRPSDKHHALHWDDVKTNNHCTNIRWGTSKENHADARRNRTRDPRGKGNGRALLSRDKVIKARRRFSTGKYTIGQIASEVRLSLSGENWPEVPFACILPDQGRRPLK